MALTVETDDIWQLAPPALLWGTSLPFTYVPARRAVMGAVPLDKGGQAGGISMTSQLMGGTVGMAVSGAIFSATHSYRWLFMVAAGAAFTALMVSALGFSSSARQARRHADPS